MFWVWTLLRWRCVVLVLTIGAVASGTVPLWLAVAEVSSGAVADAVRVVTVGTLDGVGAGSIAARGVEGDGEDVVVLEVTGDDEVLESETVVFGEGDG